jgi:hypothetical protein
MTSAWDRYKAKLGTARPWDLLNPNQPKASDDVVESRMTICESCPRFLHLTKQCRECGCVMTAKTKLIHATCPLGKW